MPLIIALLLTALALLCPRPVQARVAAFDIISRTDVAYGYEMIVGKLHIAERPNTPANRAIVDLGLAPVDGTREVEAASDIVIVHPKDASKSNGAVIVEVNNRGGKAMVWHLNQAPHPASMTSNTYWGDGFLEKHGFTMMWVGWQWDVPQKPGLMALHAPVVSDHGKTITGMVHSDFHVDSPQATHEIGDRGHTPYPVAGQNDPADVLTWRDDVLSQRHVIPREQWQFVDRGRDVALNGKFVPGKIYELVYRAKDPVVTGLGFAAERDAVSWLKHDPSAPVHVAEAYGYGISQSARFLRQMLYEGFNADEQGRIVFDGLMPIVSGAALGGFNVRFGQPSRDAAAFSSFFYPVDIPPFDDLTLLSHGGAMATSAKIMYIWTSHEYYGRNAALVTSSDDGTHDLATPPNVRYYAVMGGEHVPRVQPLLQPGMRYALNPLDYTWIERPLLLRLQAWVRSNTTPPASRYPRIADGTLVPAGKENFPAAIAIATPAPDDIHHTYRLDFGPGFPGKMTYEPAHVLGTYPLLLPLAGADGNDLGGLRLPDISVPLATYVGWNLRTAEVGFPNHLIDYFGAYLPFTPQMIAARYQNEADYLRKFDASVAQLVNDGFLLHEDEPALRAHAAQMWSRLANR